MKSLVTGATGFTGGHLAQALLREGHTVRGLVRPGSNAAALEEVGVEIFEGQLTDPDDGRRLMCRGCSRIRTACWKWRSA
jgi:2-alkyl-3-oxoalkanoate reductase